jgi:glycosyltransferase involved in cell wall biosynthesis
VRLLHIILSLEIGGAQRLLSDLLPLQKQNNEVKLLVLKSVDTVFQRIIEASGIEIIDLHCKSYHNPLIIKRLVLFMKKSDIVHVHLFPTLYWVAMAVYWCKGAKLVYTEHSTHNKRRNKTLFRPIERYIYSKYDKLISISQQTQDSLMKWLKVPSGDKRFVVIENGVNMSAFSSKVPVVTNKKQITMVSRFAQMKDQETVIRAMTDINEDAELILVGDGPNKEHCEEVVRELGLTDRVHFLGARGDISELIAQAYIGVQSSIWEGFGLTAVEFMAAHKPVVATNVDGLKQVVEGAGCLFEVGDTKALAFHINEMLRNRCLYTTLADQCYERAKRYDISRMAVCYQEVYEELFAYKR